MCCAGTIFYELEELASLQPGCTVKVVWPGDQAASDGVAAALAALTTEVAQLRASLGGAPTAVPASRRVSGADAMGSSASATALRGGARASVAPVCDRRWR